MLSAKSEQAELYTSVADINCDKVLRLNRRHQSGFLESLDNFDNRLLAISEQHQ